MCLFRDPQKTRESKTLVSSQVSSRDLTRESRNTDLPSTPPPTVSRRPTVRSEDLHYSPHPLCSFRRSDTPDFWPWPVHFRDVERVLPRGAETTRNPKGKRNGSETYPRFSTDTKEPSFTTHSLISEGNVSRPKFRTRWTVGTLELFTQRKKLTVKTVTILLRLT